MVTAIPLPEPVCRDPDLVLAAALAANADAIVTGDRDLLVLKSFHGIPILNPRDCLARLSALPEDSVPGLYARAAIATHSGDAQGAMALVEKARATGSRSASRFESDLRLLGFKE